jgi:RimJ/RimL family protein N-acetyltransferase
MITGPSVVIDRKVQLEGRPDQVALQPLTSQEVSTILPFEAGDPALGFVPERLVTLLTHPGEYVQSVESQQAIAWGIHSDGRLAGLASVYPAPGGSMVELTTFLAPDFRGVGIGKLAAAGVIRAVFKRGLLRRSSDAYASRLSAIESVIHRENWPSRKVARDAGFVYEGHGGAYNQYELNNPFVRREMYQARHRNGIARSRALLALFKIAVHPVSA